METRKTIQKKESLYATQKEYTNMAENTSGANRNITNTNVNVSKTTTNKNTVRANRNIMNKNAATTTAIVVKNLSFAYGKNQILKDISLHIPKGKITTIMGANGCGKSTLFSLMTKNLTPQAGSIFLHGQNIQEMHLQNFARQVAIVHQYNSAADDITVERLVAFGRTPYMKMMGGTSEEDEKYIEWALKVTNMTEFRDREVSRLSGGQRQRVWIAMALAQNTKILFLDEPTTYLDIRYQLDILQLVQKLNRQYGITIIMVLHDINQAIHYSDRIIGLKDGKVGIEGPPAKVITSQSIYQLYGVKLEVVTIGGEKFVLTV